MFKITITSQKHGQPWLTKNTSEEVDSYIQWCHDTEHWGKPYFVEIIPAVFDEEGTEITPEQTIPHEAEYSITVEDITEEIRIEADKQEKIVSGKKAREACQAVLDYIAGANLDKNLSIEQITQMQQTYANAETALRAGRPTLAKQLISSIDPDGIIVTSQEKTNCIILLEEY